MSFKIIGSISKKLEKGHAICFVFSLSLIVRLFHLIEISLTRPFYKELVIDAKAYDKWGQDIASGNILGTGVFSQDPLYPYFLGLVYSLFGHNLLAVVLIQGAIGSLTAVLIYLIGKRLINGNSGLIAGIMWAFYPPIIFHEGLIMKEGVAAFLATLAVYTLILAKEVGYSRYWFLCGAAFGLSALTRGNIILVIPVILLWALFDNRADFIKILLIFLLGLVVVFMPVTLRNKIVGGEMVLTTSQAGANFYWGNNKEAMGSFIPAPPFVRQTPVYEQQDFAKEAMRLTGEKYMSNSEISRFWFKKSFDFILENPWRFAWLEYQKLVLLFNKEELSDNYTFYYLNRFSTVLSYSPVTFWMISSLGLLGMVLSLGSWRRLSVLYLFIFSYSLSLIVFFVSSRYRLILAPFLTVFAALALQWGWRAISEKKYLAFISSIILLFSFIYFTGKEITWLSNLNRNETLLEEANEMERKGDHANAAIKYKELIESTNAAVAHARLADIYYNEKKIYQAIDEYKKALEVGNIAYTALFHFKLGVALTDVNRLDESILEFQASVRSDPEQLGSYFELARTFEKKGMTEESLKYWKELSERDKSGKWSSLTRDKIKELSN